MKYKILSADSAAGLEKTVTEHLDKDWTPLGGIGIWTQTSQWEDSRKTERHVETLTTLYQAMVLEDKGGNLQ